MEEIVIHVEQPLARVEQPDLLTLLLNDKRSLHTKRAYAADLRNFFGCDESELASHAERFCGLTTAAIRHFCLLYKTRLREEGKSENTINRRLAAIRSLLKLAHRLDRACTDGSNIAEGEKVTAYRDTKGVDVPTLRKLLAAPEKRYGEKPKNLSIHTYIGEVGISANRDIRAREIRREIHLTRDLAILHLLIENALRRNEVCALDVADFDASTRSLWILGKGRGNQKERITLSSTTVGAILTYLAESGHGADIRGPLFRNLDPNPATHGQRLTGNGLYRLVGEYGCFVGLKRLTPHQLRHSCLTAALDMSDGDVRKVQKLSRHKNISTLMIYDDNRRDDQGDLSQQLSKMLGKKKSA